MPRKPAKPADEPIGERIRRQRIEVLDKGLREMARELNIVPAHLTDLEKGRRTPSDDLLKRMAVAYKLPEVELRTGWRRAEAIVDEVATQDGVTTEKVPQFLRTARALSPKQWDTLIEQAQQMSAKKKRGKQT